MHSACGGKQVAYSQEKRSVSLTKDPSMGDPDEREGPLEVSGRWVVTPVFFSKKTEHTGEGEKARQGNTGF